MGTRHLRCRNQCYLTAFAPCRCIGLKVRGTAEFRFNQRFPRESTFRWGLSYFWPQNHQGIPFIASLGFQDCANSLPDKKLRSRKFGGKKTMGKPVVYLHKKSVMDETCCTQNKHAHHRHPTPCSSLISGLHHKFCPITYFLRQLAQLKQPPNHGTMKPTYGGQECRNGRISKRL